MEVDTLKNKKKISKVKVKHGPSHKWHIFEYINIAQIYQSIH